MAESLRLVGTFGIIVGSKRIAQRSAGTGVDRRIERQVAAVEPSDHVSQLVFGDLEFLRQKVDRFAVRTVQALETRSLTAKAEEQAAGHHSRSAADERPRS